jgi:hypothetical protein
VRYINDYRDSRATNGGLWKYDTQAEQWRYPIVNHVELHRRNVRYPTKDMVREHRQRGGNRDDIMPPPILLSECKMVVLADELERFKLSQHPREVLQIDKPDSINDRAEKQQAIKLKTNDEKRKNKEIDKARVQEIGRKLLENNPQLDTAQAKKEPELIPFYKKYPGRGPVIVDVWLIETGVKKRGRGREKNKNSYPQSLRIKTRNL